MITIKTTPVDAVISAQHSNGNLGWLHNCGAFTNSSDQPHRCGVCWSAGRTRWAYNGSWQRARVTKEAS